MYKKEGKTYLVEAFATLARDSNQWTKTSDKKVRTDALKLLAIKKLAIDGNIEELKGVNQESLKLNILMEINTKDAFLNSKRNTVVFLESLGIEVEWVVASQLVFEKLMKNPGKYKIDEDSRYFRRKQQELFEIIENMPEQTMTGDEWNELLESLKESVKTPENMKEEGKKLE
ncbi:hypothetical protein ACQKF0_26020 [Bacillus wiedmannii]|uniref:hypothetical protein n=1 Tax=Bacillus wiedmannii TaxID=1890302 RepID=UPI003CFDC559